MKSKTPLRDATLKRLIEEEIYPYPLMPLSAWLSMYLPKWLDKDMLDLVREEDLKT